MSATSAPAAAPPGAVLLDPVRDARWAGLVAAASGTVFHDPAWLSVLRAQYGYELVAAAVGDASGRLVAGLPIAVVGGRVAPRRLVALPFSDLCPPLVAPGAPPSAGPALARALADLAHRRRAPLEVRGRLPPGTTGAVAGARFHHHVVALEPEVGRVEARFRRGQVLRGVRRARREGLVAEHRLDAEGLAAFYRLHVMTRARLGVPTQPRRFILRLADLFAAGLGFVQLVRRGPQPVAAAVFLAHDGVLTYKYGASDARFLGARPNNLLFAEAIAWGCAHGMRELDLGRTDLGHESLRAFKLAWGADERELRYEHLGGASPRGRGRLGRALAATLRRSPPLVSRLTGEVLYRHAG